MTQKHIILVKNLNTKDEQEAIESFLMDAGIQSEVSLEKKSITIFSRGDQVSYAKRLLGEHGFSIL